MINPSLEEGISNVILEAMCTNTFVIASNVLGNRDIIKHKVIGLLFNPYENNDLLTQLFYYKEKPDLRQPILKNAKNQILSIYDIDIIANQIYQLLKSKLFLS